MALNKTIKVEVAYAKADKQSLIVVEVAPQSSIEAAILQSGILTIFPEIDLTRCKVGVFSNVRQLSDQVKEGDRIEIYRPLTIDPKEARRAKARQIKRGKLS